MAKDENPKQNPSILAKKPHPPSPLANQDLDLNSCSLEKFRLYETHTGELVEKKLDDEKKGVDGKDEKKADAGGEKAEGDKKDEKEEGGDGGREKEKEGGSGAAADAVVAMAAGSAAKVVDLMMKNEPYYYPPPHPPPPSVKSPRPPCHHMPHRSPSPPTPSAMSRTPPCHRTLPLPLLLHSWRLTHPTRLLYLSLALLGCPPTPSAPPSSSSTLGRPSLPWFLFLSPPPPRMPPSTPIP